MALINYDVLFDRLQQYIDMKIDALPYSLRALFEEYGLKIIAENIDSIIICAENIDAIIAVAEVAPELAELLTPEVIQAIKDAAQNAKLAQDAAKASLQSYWDSLAAAMTSKSYAVENVNIHVKEYYSNGDGTFTTIETATYSSLHWSVMSQNSAEGLKLQGIWDPNAGTAPITQDDPDNPGTPLPYGNGMYWYIQVDSTNQDQPDPVYGGPYLQDDRIAYLDNPDIPYTPWLQVPDIVNWNRIINIPTNVTNALDAAGASVGAFMTGNLQIKRSNPGVLLNNTNDLDRQVQFYVDDGGNYQVVSLTDGGSFIDTKMFTTIDALMFSYGADFIKYGENSLYHSGNDGSGSGLDADTVDGKHATDFPLLDKTTTDLNAAIYPGMYSYSSWANRPAGSDGSGTALVVANDLNGLMTQIYVGNDNKMYIRSGNNGLYGGWGQLGIMSFDGTRLSITL